ncbi:MAG TPA: DUF4214 domain-containing protein, partial [Pirellulales bacterium]|nr:DUF4214 domain-containing protein [Pirellulales bacterium]
KATTFAGATGAVAALNSLTVNGAADLNGGPVTTVNAQTYNGTVTLGANTTLTGSTVTFDDPVVGAAHSLAIVGNAVFGNDPTDTVTGLTTLGVSGTTAINTTNITSSGTQTYGGAVTLGANATLTGSTVTFNDPVAGAAHSLAIVGNAVFGNDPTDTVTGLTTLDVSGTTAINTTNITGSGAQTYGGAVTLSAGAVTLSSTAGGDIAFDSSVDGDLSGVRNLFVDTSGAALFGDGAGNDFVGKLHPLASLTTDAGGTTKFNVAGSSTVDPSVTTTGGQAYGDDVVLIASAVLVSDTDNAAIVFNGKVDSAVAGAASLTVDTTGGRPSGKFGQVQFNANVGTVALASLTVTTGGPFAINSTVSVTAQNDILVTVAESTPAAAGDNLTIDGALASLAGSIELRAGDDISIDAAATITASVSVTIRGDYNNNDPSAGTTILLAGKIASPSVLVFGGDGADTIDVRQTTAGSSTTINAGLGADVINISSTAPNAGGVVSTIAGPVTVMGGDGNDTLNVYDDGDAVANTTGELTSSTIAGLGMGGGITYAALEKVNVLLGDGANLTFNVKSTLATTPVDITGKGVGTVNVGDGNRLDNVQGTLTVQAVHALNLNDQAADQKQTYDISNTAVARPGTSPHVLAVYVNVAVVAVNAGGKDDTFNLFLPTAVDQPLSSTLQLNGGGGAQNTVNVVAPQTGPANGFTYFAHVGGIGGADRIQIAAIQRLYMYGSPVDSNDFANDTAVSSVLIGGENADKLLGGAGQDVLFGGGAPAGPVGDHLSSGGAVGGVQDFVFAEFRPQFNADGTVSFPTFPGNGNTVIDAGAGSAVALTPGSTINNATTVVQINGQIDVLTWLTARFVSPQAVSTILSDALANDALLSVHPPQVPFPPTRPADLPVAALASGPLDPALAAYVKHAFEDALGRDPSAAESAARVGQLSGGGSRASFAAELTHSDEYYGEIVTRAYSTFLGRVPDAAGLSYWVGQMRDHGLTDERLEAGFIGSAEYFAHAGGTNVAWVDRMYLDLLGRSADAQGQAYWVAQLQAGAARADVAFGFAASLERERQHVAFDYSHYLGRLPDPQGIDFWVMQFALGQTNENLIAGFLASDEYFSTHSS